jgi:glucokinase
LLEQLGKTDFGLAPEASDMAVIAVAGPVENGTSSFPPNIAWPIDLSHPATARRVPRGRLINDFVAQAYACVARGSSAAQPILPGEKVPGAAVAVVGAGTGLGLAALVALPGGGWVEIPSEDSHGSFAFESRREMDYMEFLLRQTGSAYIEAETVVSGQGLSLLHHYLTGEELEPADIGARLNAGSETLQWLARFYGRFCRNYALQVLARGGVFVSGGVAAKNLGIVTYPEFAAEFRRSRTMGELLARVPVFLNTDEERGLWGAAHYALQALLKNRSISGKR